MRRRNWLLAGVLVVGAVWFALSRTVWGPPARAVALEPTAAVGEDEADGTISDSQRRFISNQPRHWRYVMLKTR